MTSRKALKRTAASPALAFPLALAGALRNRHRAAKARGADAGLTSLEYAMLAAGILVVVVLLLAAITRILNVRIGVLNGL